MTSSNGNIFRDTGPLCGEFTGHQWIPHTKASDAELWCFLLSTPEWTVEYTIVRLVIWDAIALFMPSLWYDMTRYNNIRFGAVIKRPGFSIITTRHHIHRIKGEVWGVFCEYKVTNCLLWVQSYKLSFVSTKLQTVFCEYKVTNCLLWVQSYKLSFVSTKLQTVISVLSVITVLYRRS